MNDVLECWPNYRPIASSDGAEVRPGEGWSQWRRRCLERSKIRDQYEKWVNCNWGMYSLLYTLGTWTTIEVLDHPSLWQIVATRNRADDQFTIISLLTSQLKKCILTQTICSLQCLASIHTNCSPPCLAFIENNCPPLQSMYYCRLLEHKMMSV